MKSTPSISIKPIPNPFRGKKSLALAALLLVPAAGVLAQSQWIGGTSDYNVPTSWNPTGVPSGSVNASNDSGTNNVVLIQDGDPVWQHGDTLAGNGAGTSGAYLQTGSTNNTGGGNWFRLALGTGSYGSYVLSNGVVNVGGQTHIGEYGVGYLEIDGGVFNTAADPFCLGDGDFGPSPVGYMVMNGGTNNIASEFWIGEGNATKRGTGYFTMNGGTINVNFWWDIGRWGADGYFTMNGGTINKTGGGDCQWGAYNNGVPSSATVNMSGGTINVNNNLQLGTGGNGSVGGTCLFNQSGGTVHVGGEYWVGNDNSAAFCTNNVSGNAVLIVDNWFAVGRFGGLGTLNLSGNAAITKTSVHGGNITIGSGTSIGVINQDGGTFTNTATQSWIAENGQGFWTLNSGQAVLGVIHLTQNAGAQGIFNLNGGDLTATEITDNNGSGYLNLNGGTLHVGASPANPWMHGVNGAVNVMASGVTINTEGNDAISTTPLSDGGGGGLIKTGSGTLTLAGANTYSGPTIVSNGAVVVGTGSSSFGTYTVKDGAGFGVVVTSAGGQFTPPTVNLGTTTGTTLLFDLGAFGNPTATPLNITGNLAVNGNTVVNIADASPQLGQFHLLQYSAMTGSGTFTLGTLPNGVQANLVVGAGFVDLNITAVALNVWNGLAGGDWDINVTTNWSNFGTSLPTTYLDPIPVIFNDTALGTTVVNLVTNVLPRTVTIFNDVSNYTLVGNGRINGTVGLNKGGAATFAIYNTNGFTGPVVISGGTLTVTNLANGGAVSAIGASSANPTNLVFNGGALSYAGAPVSINRGYTLQANYGNNGTAGTNTPTLDLQGNLTLTGQMTAANGTGFVKSGPGTLTYSGVGTNELSGGNNPGYQVTAGTLVFNGSAGSQVNHNRQDFWVGDTTNSGANIILTNTTLNVDGWFALSRGNGDSSYICTGNLYNSTMTCGNFSLGWQNGRPNLCSQVFTMTNSTLRDGGNFLIAESAGSLGSVFITGNSLVVCSGGNPMLMGLAVGSTGNVVVANSSIVTNNAWLSCGANGYGTLTLKDNAFYAEGSDFNFGDYGGSGTTGILTFQDNAKVVMTGNGNGVYVGKTAASIGIVNQSGNTVLDSRKAGVFQLAQQASSSGTWLQSGGTNYAGGWVSIGRGYTTGDLSPSGLLRVSGGLFDQVGLANGLMVGEQGTGELTITNTGLVIAESTNIGVAIGWNVGSGTLNLGGGTLVANVVQGSTNGGSSTINFTGGSLVAGPAAQFNFMTNINAAYVYAGVKIDTGNNKIDISSALLDAGGGGGLTKTGNGTLLLDGANTYTGTTAINAGTLGGSGTIAGPVAIAAGATLSPGNSIGTLTLSGTALTLAGTSTTIMELNKAAGTNDSVTGASTITYGGTLVLKNLNGTLQIGDTFTLFTAGSYPGSFSSVISQTPNQTVTWDTSQLAVNGTVKVATAVTTPATITTAVSGGNLNLSWPASQIGWELQYQINSLTVGISTNWVVVPSSTTTNQVSIPLVNTTPSEFFRLVFPQQ